MNSQSVRDHKIIAESMDEIEYIDELRTLSKSSNKPRIKKSMQKVMISPKYNKRAYQNIYYQLNKDYFEEYRQKNKERSKLYAQKYNAKRRALRAIDREIKRHA